MDTDPGAFPQTNRPDLGLRVDPLAALEGVSEQERQHISNRHRQSFGAIIAAVGSPPCIRSCPWYFRCRSERLACAAFLRYVDTGQSHRVPGEVPTRARYARLFGG